jgi:hypothetical protein
MSEVNSVNGETGAVVLTAAKVEAIPQSEAGQPSGVATLNSGGQLLTAQLPASVEISTQPSGDTTGKADVATINAALAALPVVGEWPVGRIRLAAGTWYLAAGELDNPGPQVYIQGAGRWATLIKGVGAGDVFRIFDASAGRGNWTTISAWGGALKDLTIDGTGMGTSSKGVHMGDIEEYTLDVAIQNFTEAGARNLHIDNTLWWTEKCHIKAHLRNGTQLCVLDVNSGPAYGATTLVSATGGTAIFTRKLGWGIPGSSLSLQEGMTLLGSAGLTTPTSASVSTLSVHAVSGETLECRYTGTAPSGTEGTLTVVNSTNSFEYNDIDLDLFAAPNQDGFVLQNGAELAHCPALRLRGNFLGSESAMTSAAVRITGVCPTGHSTTGLASALLASHVVVVAEVNAGAHSPQTIVFGTVNANSLLGCSGILAFTGFAASNCNPATTLATFRFLGPIIGDANLNPSGVTNVSAVHAGGTIYGQGSLSAGALAIKDGDYFSQTLSSNTTLAFTSGLSGPQRKVIVLKQAASGGPYTVTWPHEGSPTTAKPAVLWAGGAVPTMSAAANAIDVYELRTIDGATWYGNAIQNVS